MDKVDPLLIFDWYHFTMKLEMAVGATRRRRWASFEGDLAVLKLNGRLIFWALVGHFIGPDFINKFAGLRPFVLV